MGLRDRSQAVAVLTALQGEVSRALAAAKAALQAEMELSGADTVSAALPDGTKVAQIPLARPKPRARIVDERALLGWVREHNPAEVVTVETVRPSYRDVLLDQVTVTGELPDGVEVTERQPYLTVRGVDTHAIADAWRTGVLDPVKYLELEAGE